MMTEKLQKVLNEQVTAEMWSANLYLSMSFHLEREGYTGFASWLKKQSQEEMEHAYAIAGYIIKRGGIAKVDKIDVVPTGWGTPLEVFEHVYEHECHVSKMIDGLVAIASSEKDNATQDFLWDFFYVRKMAVCYSVFSLYMNNKIFFKKVLSSCEIYLSLSQLS